MGNHVELLGYKEILRILVYSHILDKHRIISSIYGLVPIKSKEL